MRTRHKTPALVSMWMLDVFCCALGCVILLWVLESLSSAESAKRAKAASSDLDTTRSQLLSTREDFDQTKRKLNAEVDDLRGRLTATLADLASQEKQLVQANADLRDTKKTLSVSSANLQALEGEMSQREKRAAELTESVTKLRTAETNLQKLLREQELLAQNLDSAKKKADDRLSDLDAKYRALQKESSESTSSARSMTETVEKELATTRMAVKELRKQLDDSNASIIDLQGDKKKLADKFDKLRVDTDSRFAGIAMTGKRVVFMVDISGSMKLIDEKTPDGNKWPGVIETVGKVMRTIPDLEKFQVVVFSRNARFLIGSGEWQAYKGEDSVKQVMDGLKETTPGGDTNLYLGFDLAFQLRGQSLDTIYLFSDGLPTSGQGLTQEQERNLTDAQRSDALSKYLRSTLKTVWNRAETGRRVKVNAVGFFYESPDVGAFLWALARENEGSFVGMSKP
jgi:predicted  nucleic acid-binding Zn-ribbon protein